MRNLKEQIVADMVSKIEAKKNEARMTKQKCQELQNEIYRMSCETSWSSYYQTNQHVGNCARCRKKDSLENLRKSVSYYQRPLPNVPGKGYFQDAVVFELLLPVEIAFLRNSLAIFLGELCGHTLFEELTQAKDMHVTWTSFGDLSRFGDRTKAGYASEVRLGSKTKSIMDSHYGNSNLDVMSAHEDSFILDNGLSLNFFFNPRLNFQLSEEYFRFQIKNTSKQEPYANLQFSLNLPRPTENEVISLQYTYHQKLQLKEFLTYGSMRSGHRIQLRNLYAAIANETISLEQEPVLALILQTIWEVGPRVKENVREIHADFYEKTFSLEFLELLERILKSNSTNWSCPMVILTVIVLTIRILELNENYEVRKYCTKILKQTRNILESWWKKMEDIILNSEASSGSTNDMAELKELLFLTSLCSAFTFNVSSLHLMPHVIYDQEDVKFWLHTVARMYHMVVREKTHESCSKFLQNLLRHARQISLNIESYITTQLSQQTLHEYSSRQWTGAETTKLTSEWYYHHDDSHSKTANIYSLKYEEYQDQKIHTVHIDILRGVFLVDGYPPSHLPENIMQHPLFNLFFQHCRFRIQRDSRTFRTLNQYEDNHYEFYFTKEDGALIIQELHEDYSLELLPPALFKGQLSSHFINSYTHWLHTKTNEVYFRPKITKSSGSVKKDPEFVLISNGQKMLLKKYPANSEFHRFVLSINSHGFNQIVNNLRKLETSDFIDITLETNQAAKKFKIYANLRRFNLTFELEKKDGLLYSQNFPGFYVSPNQAFGTFTGLQSGLLLEKKCLSDVSGFKKLFLIQHGHIERYKNSNKAHQSVCINFLRKPPMFTFEVDQILHRLKAGNDKSAWLYLAALHASTSSPFPDTFTGLTGTEMAMWILQSGLVWSCSPYDKESLCTLQIIRNLSPHRVYYPDHLKEMQKTRWPAGLNKNSYAAYDGYSIVVDYLINCSNRLKGLFPDFAGDIKNTTLNNTKYHVPKLKERAYFRHINLYNKCAQLGDSFVGHLNQSVLLQKMKCLGSFGFGSPPEGGWMELAKVRMLGLPHFTPSTKTITSLIMTSEILPYDTSDTLSGDIFNMWFATNFRENWLRLYALALKVNRQPSLLQHEFTLLLGALLYRRRVSLEQALNLHNISCLPPSASYEFPPVISSWRDYIPTSNSWVSTDIERILKSCAKDFPQSENEFSTYAKYLVAYQDYTNDKDSAMQRAKAILINYWPTSKIGLRSVRDLISSYYVNHDTLTTEISSTFAFWFNNRELKLFVDKVDEAMEKASSDHTRKMSVIITAPRQSGTLYFDCIKDKSDEIEMAMLIKPLESLLHLQQLFSTGQLAVLEGKTKMEQRLACIKLINMITKNLQDLSSMSENGKALNEAGIHFRFAPLVILRSLLKQESKSENVIKDYAGALAVLFTHLRRLNRIIYFERDPKTYSVELERETTNKPFENWSPEEYPEWLLLELELDVTIRAVQVRVAKHMMNMSGNGVKNGVTQLNMGEGKTSVIVPMIVSKLSSNEDMLCRVTVLSSIFTTNFSLLSFTIGGLLNRRLYTVPCRRDYKISEFLPQIQQTYDECMKQNGVIMTLPEYRLSFRLMMYNYYLQNKYDLALQVYNIENWLRQHARDIVDESDEIFSVKYQLIYTTGHQLNIDGGNMRWVVCQKLLQILPQVASQLFDKFGPNIVEFSKEEATSNSEQFTHFRILDSKCKNDFHELMADAILDGKVDLLGLILKEQDRSLVKTFLVNENLSEDEHKTFVNWKGIDEEQKLVLLLVSGYLRRGVFFSAFCKRWRVECGVNDKGDKLMAVPFRAKDVAAERTEFGHPDMAIVLTQLSYYYSGLNDEQLYEAFNILRIMTGPEKDYNSWMRAIPNTKNIHDSIKMYKGINLLDYEQRTKYLFPILRRHKLVIDFWLENVVFPKESKQFPGKLVMNAWDLCYEKQNHSTTGFSGTNDSSLLLPATISQQDLEELKKTNEELEITIQRQENQCKRSLEMGVSCNTILKFMTQDNLRVLIDAGAIVLELGNEALAQRWLDLDPTLEGVVYFTTGNELVIKTRSNLKESGGDVPLKLSPYRERLENCAVYLDDYHTRGTDLKLPTNFKACVTIGSSMRRDKLVQACMRMRKLGKGQSIQFYLSHEAANKILEMNKNNGDYFDIISVKDILLWVGHNSKQFEVDGLPYWAASAKNYTQKLAADEIFETSPDKSSEAGDILAKQCEDPEVFDLQTLYGTYKSKTLLLDVIPNWFLNVKEKLLSEDNLTKLSKQVLKMIGCNKRLVQNKIQEHAPNQEFLFSMLEEEQEKELEPEQEREVQVERPPRATPLTPKMHQNVELFVKLGGKLHDDEEGIVRLGDVFRNTTFSSLVQPECWNGNFYATEDFLSVIQSNGYKLDGFLRTMTYITSWTAPSPSPTADENQVETLLLLSPFEVNELMPLFRRNHKDEIAVTLHMFTGRLIEGQDILVNKTRLQLPISRQGVHLNEVLMAPFLIAAGNLFFTSMEEQKAFASYLGLRPRPWNDEEEAAFKAGLIEKTGFVRPNSDLSLSMSSRFERDPSGMVRAILKCRNDVLRDSDHTIRLLNQCAYILELK
ncbi:unnamed protein product [Orchesella dallaii]|uniref:ubiquitinyl hydrolase 1 n=1 Tax=Orchesella dallaii TaxID=48710 RepID=A0ABP1RSI2_9HEXA